MINKQTSILLLSIALVIIGSLGFHLPSIQFDYELENFFPKNDPDLSYYESFSKTFGHDNDYLLLGFESNSSLFDIDFLSKIEKGLKQISKNESTIRVISPTSVRTLAKTPLGFVPIPLLHLTESTKLKKDSSKLAKHPLYSEMFYSKSGKSFKAIVNHKRFKTKEQADSYVLFIKGVFKEQNPRVRIAGKAIAQTAFVEAVKSDFTKYILISLVLIFVWLIVFMRKLLLIITTLCIAGLAVVATIGLMALTGKRIDVLTSLIPTILLVVTMSNIIHLFSHIRQNYLLDQSLRSALNQAVSRVGFATALTSLTTAIGFFTLIMINVQPIIDLGKYAAGGIVLTFIITYLLFPSAVTLLNSKPTPSINEDKFEKGFLGVFETIGKKGNRIIMIAIITFLICLPGLSRLNIDAYLVNDLPNKDLVRNDFMFFDQDFSGSKPITLSLWVKSESDSIYCQKVISELNKVEQLIKKHTNAGDLISPVTLVKLANQNLHRGSPSYYRLPTSQKEWKQAFHQIKVLNMERKFIKVSTHTSAQITGYFQDLGSKDATEKHASLLQALNQKIDQNILGYRLTGTTLLIDKSHELLSINLLKGLGLAILIVGFIAGLLFRSWRMIIITLIPNLFPILAVAAIMGYFNIPLNLSTAVIFAISFGIVVDDTIHFLSQFKLEFRAGKNKHNAVKSALIKTGHPILITTIILTTGFLIFCFSSFSAVYYMGLFVSISFVMALLADLYLLPTLLMMWFPDDKK